MPMPLPTFYVPHGAGPCFFMDWDPPHEWDHMGRWLQSLERHAGRRPRALVVISAHWESAQFTINGAANPGLLYDYYGFPPHTYDIQWQARGDAFLAERIQRLLQDNGIKTGIDTHRGLDHGVFVPMKLAFPGADVPVVQVSLRADLDPAGHLAMGRALAPLRWEDVLIVGSGMSYHNMQRFKSPHTEADPDSLRFDRWLVETVSLDEPERSARLARWSEAPAARAAHPREEHLLPLQVAVGAAGQDPGHRVLQDEVLGSIQSAFRFGEPA